jgi:AsmA protein
MTQPIDHPAPRRASPSPLFWRVTATLVVPLLILIVGTFFVLMNFNPNRYAPALVSALEQMTGRQVTLSGPVKIKWSLTPAIQASNIAIANPPGFSDQNVLTIGALRAEISLFPLLSHRVDILKLVMISPHLTLERLASGKADWDFSAASAQRPTGGTSFLHSNIKVALEAVEVQDGLVTIRGSAGNPAGIIHLSKLTGTAASLSAPLHLDAAAEIGATPFDISGSVGPIERFSGIGSGPWPINLTATLAGAKLTVDGTVKRPRNASGYDLAVSLSIPALDKFGQALPPAATAGLSLPPLQNFAVAAHIKDRNATLPAITNVTISAGKSDLSALRPGLMLTALTVNIPGLDQPFTITATGTSDSGNLSLQGQFGALQTLINPAWLPAASPVQGSFPISVTAHLGDANASITGGIATPQTLSGTALAIAANIPDLSALSTIAGMALPAWKHIALQTSLIDPGGVGLYSAAALDDLTVTMDNAALGGAATLYLAPQTKFQLSLNFTQANLDALLASFQPPNTAVTTAPAATVPAAVPPGPATPSTAVIPATPLPLGFLSWGNAEIQLSADNVLWNGANYTAVQANATLTGKKLTIDPASAEIPGGRVAASASLDASGTPVTETLAIKAPALALGPLLKALGQPGAAEGNLQFQLTAASSGTSPREIAANLNGQLGLATVNDQIDAPLINRAFGPVIKAAGLPPATLSPATIRCFGLSATANQGVVSLTSFGLDSSQYILQGTGGLNLGQESYNLAFQPFNAPPVQLGGSFAQPVLTAAPQPTGMPAAPSATPQRPDICPATLAQARLGQAGPAALPPAAAGAAPVAAGVNAPKNLLNSLLAP